MKGFSFFLMAACLVAACSADDVCHKGTKDACSDSSVGSERHMECNALYGGFDHLSGMMQEYTSANLKQSYDYLLMSSYFSNYQRARPGFQKVFRELSDKLWDNTISLIKHITKRGGSMDFTIRNGVAFDKQPVIELTEIGAMAYALDTEKELAKQANDIHEQASRNSAKTHEPEIAHYLEEDFMEKQAEEIRKLSGYTNDLKNLYKSQNDISLATFLFDEYLTKA